MGTASVSSQVNRHELASDEFRVPTVIVTSPTESLRLVLRLVATPGPRPRPGGRPGVAATAASVSRAEPAAASLSEPASCRADSGRRQDGYASVAARRRRGRPGQGTLGRRLGCRGHESCSVTGRDSEARPPARQLKLNFSDSDRDSESWGLQASG